MTTTALLLQHISELFTPATFLIGGKFPNKNIGPTPSNPSNNIIMIFLILLLLLIKGFIVYLVYNMMVPKILYSISLSNKSLEDIESNFKEITFMESVLLVILTQTLFTN